MARIKVSEIRKKYPFPESSRKKNKESFYCVGGAFYIYIHPHLNEPGFYSQFFPGEDMIKWFLREENPKLTGLELKYFAEGIIFENDRENFEEAWSLLEVALNKGEDNVSTEHKVTEVVSKKKE